MTLAFSQEIRVPYGLSVHDEEEIAAVVRVLQTSTQMGKNVREFECKISQLFEKRYGIMVNSGSSANYLAVEILDLPKEGEVITPILTFATTIAPWVKHGYRPAFVDVEPGTYNIDSSLIEQMIGPKTVALMIPSLLGNLPNWGMIHDLTQKYGLKLIEDSADTLGAMFRGKSTGAWTDVSTTSFYGSHVINCAGNGGMLCVNDESLATDAKLLRSWGRRSSLFVESETIDNRFNTEVNGIPYDAKFVFDKIGYNWEPSELGAAFGLVQLKKLSRNIELRTQYFKSHLNFFEHYRDWFILPRQQQDSMTAWLSFPLTLQDKAPFTRRDFQIFFEQRNIQTRTIFTGNILRQPGFSKIAHRPSERGYPHADQVMRSGILLPCHHGLRQEQMDHIHYSFQEFVKKIIN